MKENPRKYKTINILLYFWIMDCPDFQSLEKQKRFILCR